MHKAAADMACRGRGTRKRETMTDDELRSGEAALVQTQADDALLESEPRYHALLR